jgi:hypothetical protein
MSVPAHSPPAQAGEPIAPDLVEETFRLAQAVRAIAHDHVQLAVLETRHSINALLTMAAVAIAMAVLIVSAWLALLGAAVLALNSLGLSPALALLALATGNLLLLPVGYLVIRHKGTALGWPASLRALAWRPIAGDSGTTA